MACPDVTDAGAVLAASAAAAIASGGVPLPDDGAGAAGTAVTATGIATAMGFATSESRPVAAGPTATSDESALDVSPDAGFPVGFVSAVCGAAEPVTEFCAASALAPEGWVAFVPPWEAGLPFADGLAEATSRDGLLSVADGALSELDQRGGAAGAGAAAALLSVAVLVSISDANMPLPGVGSSADRAGLGGAAWNETLVAASDVGLRTDGLSR